MEIITRSKETGTILEIIRYPEGHHLTRRIVSRVMELMMLAAMDGEQNVFCTGALNAAVETHADGSTIYGKYLINGQVIRAMILAE